MRTSVGNRAISLGGIGGLVAGTTIGAVLLGGTVGFVAGTAGSGTPTLVVTAGLVGSVVVPLLAILAGRLVGWVVGIGLTLCGGGLLGHPVRNRWAAAGTTALASTPVPATAHLPWWATAGVVLLAATIGACRGADLVRPGVVPATVSG